MNRSIKFAGILGAMLALAIFLPVSRSSAQMMGGSAYPVLPNDHTSAEEAAGKLIWQKLDSKELSCKGLSDKDFIDLGEYYMGQMAGNNHSALNAMIGRMIGDNGEMAMHEVMGRRLSGCDPNAEYPSFVSPFLGMMQFPMMLGYGVGSPSCNFISGGIIGEYWWIFALAAALWIFAIVGIIVLIQSVRRRYRSK